MKTSIMLSIAIMFTSLIFGQDVITKRDRTELQTRVVEIGVNEIKYKNFDNSGPAQTDIINSSEKSFPVADPRLSLEATGLYPIFRNTQREVLLFCAHCLDPDPGLGFHLREE